MKRTVSLVSFLILTLIVLTALLAGVVTAHDPLAQDADSRLKPPGPGHPFGTDGQGRDVFSRVVYGSRASLYVGVVAIGISALIGVSLGLTSAYRGGLFDLIVQRLVDMFLGFPFLVLALIIVVASRSSSTSVAVAIGLALAPQVARMSRASALTVRSETYILAAKCLGATPFRIIRRHLLPNSLAPILAQLSGYFGAAVVAEVTLSFLGLGVPAPYPSWGGMLQEGARQYLEVAPWITLFPGLVLSLTVVSFALLGDALRDRLDPRR